MPAFQEDNRLRLTAASAILASDIEYAQVLNIAHPDEPVVVVFDADGATYWLADCYFKQGNFSAAVLRFDDVARNFPSGDKAPDALYRQGEALLRMGHGTAAGNAFEKVIRDYPNSARAPEAKRQLQMLGKG